MGHGRSLISLRTRPPVCGPMKCLFLFLFRGASKFEGGVDKLWSKLSLSDRLPLVNTPAQFCTLYYVATNTMKMRDLE